jgi:fluoride ion exporter CrcB/FEX
VRLKPAILFAVFVGGAFGSLARLAVVLGVELAGASLSLISIAATGIVNLVGAALLGFVHSHSFRAGEIAKSFWGPGFAGGFTTMSGLALISTGFDLGIHDIRSIYLYWLAVIAQFALGVLAYRITKTRFDQAKKTVS